MSLYDDIERELNLNETQEQTVPNVKINKQAQFSPVNSSIDPLVAEINEFVKTASVEDFKDSSSLYASMMNLETTYRDRIFTPEVKGFVKQAEAKGFPREEIETYLNNQKEREYYIKENISKMPQEMISTLNEFLRI